MSEKLNSPEIKSSSENSVEHKGNLEKANEKLREDAEKAEKHNRKHEAKEALKTAESLAKPSAERNDHTEQGKNSEPVTRGLKNQSYKQTMQRVEAKLSAPQRAFSKVINNPTVDRTSAVVGRTVARPSGIIGAGVIATLGMISLLYYANKIGFEVSAFSYILLLGFGWVLGLLVEFLYRMVKTSISK